MNTTRWLHAALDEIERLHNHEQTLAARIKDLEGWLVDERADKKISRLCNCEKCWPRGKPKSATRILAEDKARQEARSKLIAEGKIGGGDKDGN